MKRRDFLKSTTAVGGGILTGLHKAAAQSVNRPVVPGPQPNILFILVDELRFPTVFPGNITTPGEFLAKFMPNLFKLWQNGVKFGNHNTAANACTPSRGVLITGLYSQQSWLLATILSTPFPTTTTQPQPVLNPAYPTWGKLLRAANYQTPYVGKWHVSVPGTTPNTLDPYGFDFYKSYYDPTGTNLQGTYGDENRGYHSDAFSVGNAIDWLNNKRPANQPWCLTVSLVNPHDREFFPAGTEFQTVNDLFASPTANPSNLKQNVGYPGNGPVVRWSVNQLKSPPSFGYPTLPPNWEKSLASKPSTQTFIKEFSQLVWGGATEDPSQDTATIQQYPNPNPAEDLDFGVAKMPFSYWQRGLDSYTQIMQIVDVQIGRVLDAFHDLPQSVVENTVIVFASDHGEYNGAHGLMQGKIGTVYEEAWHVPLIVVDPSNRYTGDIDTIRSGLTSHVDFLTLMTSIGNLGSRDWMTGDLATIYGERHDMISMLKSADAPGRPYVLYATDEVVPNFYNFNNSPFHVLGMRTEDSKLGVYAKWIPFTSQIIPTSIETEFYDYSTTAGQLELNNTAATDPRVPGMVTELLTQIVPQQLQAKLPGSLGTEQEGSKIAHLIFDQFIQLQPSGVWKNGGLTTLLGFGAEF